jgi:hypothetical protein
MEAPSAQPLLHYNQLKSLNFYVALKEPNPKANGGQQQESSET